MNRNLVALLALQMRPGNVSKHHLIYLLISFQSTSICVSEFVFASTVCFQNQHMIHLHKSYTKPLTATSVSPNQNWLVQTLPSAIMLVMLVPQKRVLINVCLEVIVGVMTVLLFNFRSLIRLNYFWTKTKIMLFENIKLS